MTLEKESEGLLASAEDVSEDNRHLQRQLQDITKEVIDFRKTGTISDCSKLMKKDLLVDLEQKNRILKDIKKLHDINEDKVKASIYTKQALIAEYKQDIEKQNKKVRDLRAEVAKKNHLLGVEEEPYKVLKQKYDAEKSKRRLDVEKNDKLETDLKKHQESVKNSKREIEFQETKLVDLESRRDTAVTTSSTVDLEYYRVQVDNVRDQIKQLQRQMHEKELAFKQSANERQNLDDEIQKEKAEARDTTAKIKKLQDNYEELKQLKSLVLERKERSTGSNGALDLKTIKSTVM